MSLLTLLVVTAAMCGQITTAQNCFKVTTCDQQQPQPLSRVQGSPGKMGPRGMIGLRGPAGLKGERGSGCERLESELSTLRRDFTEMSSRLQVIEKSSEEQQNMISTLNSSLENTVVDLKKVEKMTYRYTYEIRKTPRRGNFEQCRQMCVDMGGELLQNTIKKSISGTKYLAKINALVDTAFYVGLTDEQEEEVWRFLDGSILQTDDCIFRWFWHAHKNSRTHNCIDLYTNHLINDISCSAERFGLCEI